MGEIMALGLAVFIATVALSAPVVSLPVSGNRSPSDEAALKCIIEVLSGALSPAQPHSLASAECVEILRGDDRISAMIHQHDLLSQLEEIAGRGNTKEHVVDPPAPPATNHKLSETGEEVKEEEKKNEAEEEEDDEGKRVFHEEKDKKYHDTKKKGNDGDDDDVHKEEEGEDETKSGVEGSREFYMKRRESGDHRERAGDKSSTGHSHVEPRHGEGLEMPFAPQQSNEEGKRDQGGRDSKIGDKMEEQVPHQDNSDDGDEEEKGVRLVGTDGADEEEVSETPARHGAKRVQRGPHAERNSVREEHNAHRQIAEELLEYLGQIRQRLGQKQQQQQQQWQHRGDYSRYLEKGGTVISRKSGNDDVDEVQYEEQNKEVDGRHSREEVEDDTQEQEDEVHEDRDDDDEEQDGGEEVFEDGVGRSHRWVGRSVRADRRPWGAEHSAENKEMEDDVAKDGDEAEEDEEEQQLGQGGGAEWRGDKRAQDTQSHNHGTLNSKQLLELKAMEHELVKIAERLGERLG